MQHRNEAFAVAWLYEPTFLGPVSDQEKLVASGAQHLRALRCPGRTVVEASEQEIVLGQQARCLKQMGQGQLAPARKNCRRR